MGRVRPLEKTPVTTPSPPMVNDCRVPREEPSCERAATLDWPANWRSAVASPTAPKSTSMVPPAHEPVATVGLTVRDGAGLKAGGVAVGSQTRLAVPTVTGACVVMSGMVAVTVQALAAVLAKVQVASIV